MPEDLLLPESSPLHVADPRPATRGRVRPGPHRTSDPDRLRRLIRIADYYISDERRWRPLVRFDPEQRWYRRLDTGPDHEAWLLSWLPGQGTGLHDHGFSAGAVAVAAGSLTEQAVTVPWERKPVVSAGILTAGQVRAFGSRYVHEMANLTDVPAVSVHVYSPALTEMNHYSITEQGLVRLGREKAGADW